MRILQLPSWYIPEGGQFCLHQSIALSKKGIDVHILANVNLPWRKYPIGRYGFGSETTKETHDNIITFRKYSRSVPFLDWLNRRRWIYRTKKMVEHYITIEGKPDVIHCQGSIYASCVAAHIKRKYNIPYIITEHWSAFSGKSALSRKLIEKKAKYIKEGFSLASHIVMVSDEIGEVVDRYNKTNVPVSTISNIIDTDYFYPQKRQHTNRCFVFVTANSYRVEKGYDILLNAVEILKTKGEEFKLLIAGRGFENKIFQKSYAGCKAKKNIEFLGLLSKLKIRDLLLNADAFVISSRNESQSIAVLEALSCGIPVVGTEVIPKLFVNEKTGFRVPIENPELLAAAMEAMMKNHELYDSEYLHSVVQRHASPSVVADSLIEIYKKVIK